MSQISPETESERILINRVMIGLRVTSDLDYRPWKDVERAVRAAVVAGHAQTPAHRIDDHMTRARRLVENHIEAFGMVPHPDLIKDAIADMSQQSFDLGFRAAGGSVSDTSTDCEGK
jgi:hypothetical protein